MNEGKTHWEGCETEHGHSECAKRVIEDLKRDVAELAEQRKKFEGLCGDRIAERRELVEECLRQRLRADALQEVLFYPDVVTLIRRAAECEQLEAKVRLLETASDEARADAAKWKEAFEREATLTDARLDECGERMKVERDDALRTLEAKETELTKARIEVIRLRDEIKTHCHNLGTIIEDAR